VQAHHVGIALGSGKFSATARALFGEDRVRLAEEAGDGLLAAGDGDVSEVEGPVSRVHDYRWGRRAQTKEEDLCRDLAEKGGVKRGL